MFSRYFLKLGLSMIAGVITSFSFLPSALAVDHLPQDPLFYRHSPIGVRPEIPQESEVLALPSSGYSSRKLKPDCVAAYLIEKFAPPPAPGSHRVFYDLRVTNVGTCPLYDLTLSDFFPHGTFLMGAMPTPNFFAPDAVAWVIPFLGIGGWATAKIELGVHLLPPPPPPFPQGQNQEQNHDQRQAHEALGRRLVNSGCIWSPMVGQRACAFVSTWID